MVNIFAKRYKSNVAPFVGAWIEIVGMPIAIIFGMSLRSSERGLKYYYVRWF